MISVCLLGNFISCTEHRTNETTNIAQNSKIITKTSYPYELNGINFTTEDRHPFRRDMFKYFNVS